uniref:hypothetical protein n=1 Tax=Altericroceibacterium xinjiangense TaxID=762261 RepID=UPI0019D17607
MNARRWRADLMETCRKWIQVFRGTLAEHALQLLADVDARFADFNVESNESSTVPQSGINDSCYSGMHGSVLRTGNETLPGEQTDEELKAVRSYGKGRDMLALNTCHAWTFAHRETAISSPHRLRLDGEGTAVPLCGGREFCPEQRCSFPSRADKAGAAVRIPADLLKLPLIPRLVDHDRWAHRRLPMDMMRQGWS